MSDPYTEDKRRILEAALIEADFGGWQLETLRAAADKAGIARDRQRLAFPRGVLDLIELYSDTADAVMADGLKAHDLAALKVRERVKLAVRLRIEALAAHKPAARAALHHLASPLFAAEGMKLLYRTVDTIWREIGDTSTDFNFYSKRALLAGVYASTLWTWTEDMSGDCAKTWAFLDRRIENVMGIEKAKAKLRGALSKLPDPLKVLSALRYPDRGA
ncbi:MAG: COQ9 family protein [Alphaproteobacteria bacterium]